MRHQKTQVRWDLYMETDKSAVQDPKISFEGAAARIDEIVRLLERGDAPLDESLVLFEEGARLIKIAGKMLDEAEQTVVRLQKGADGKPRESLFDDE